MHIWECDRADWLMNEHFNILTQQPRKKHGEQTFGTLDQNNKL